ncbi:MAG: ABC transporter substrate-binding protein [Propionicimonas sp.]|uniref:ABC transporter substrate-binding protein n=1 Tax=Propionicimonas sp. TaxID=1955623 RepID=UPI002B1EAD2B|nr:ABC transporter substrate-binding protein [Propionicimonas sp.]MEA4944857.1 ABC transporter substrate-binding protein [Propionicimonas sp.]MEA5052296.1 ABC transporter substrate-binding protein [Propionicimonas sp.]MEA5119390.1 ABC transporter substrate-binding protein [Propionicimonas sp.]
MNKRVLSTIALVGGLAVALSACSGAPTESSSSSDSTPAASSAAGALAPATATADMMAKLPQKYSDAGVLKVATTDGNAPWSFLDPSTREASGVDADLINEAAKRLGLKVEWSDVQFTAALPGVQGGRFDIYLSAMADRTDRQEVVNFIDYSTEGSAIVVPKGNPKNITGFASLCGLRVNYLTGSLFPPLIEELNSTDCKDNKIQATESADKQAIYLAVASGQADATFDTYGVSNYQFNTAKEGVGLELEIAPVPPFAPANQGIAFSQAEPDLLYAMAGAMQQMVEDGSYQAIFDKWSVGDLALTAISINTVLDSKLMDFFQK